MRNLNDTAYWKKAMRTGVIGMLRPETLVSLIRDRVGDIDEDVWLAVHGQVLRDAVAEMRSHRRLQRGSTSASRVKRNLARDDQSRRPGIPRIEVDDILGEAVRILLEALDRPQEKGYSRLVGVLATEFPIAINNIISRAEYQLDTRLNDRRKVPAEIEQGKSLLRRVMRSMTSLDHGSVIDAAAREDEDIAEIELMRLLTMMRKHAVARGVLVEFEMRRGESSFEAIGKKLNVSGQTVRNRLAELFRSVELDPDYVNRKRASARKAARSSGGAAPTPPVVTVAPGTPVPPSVTTTPVPAVTAPVGTATASPPSAGAGRTMPGTAATPVPATSVPGLPASTSAEGQAGGGGNDPGPGTPMAAAP